MGEQTDGKRLPTRYWVIVIGGFVVAGVIGAVTQSAIVFVVALFAIGLAVLIVGIFIDAINLTHNKP